MPKTTAEKIAINREKMKQLQNEEKRLLQKERADERKARTRRFCSRHGLLEKFMPDLATITDEQYETFIRKGINTTYGQKILAEIVGSTGTITTPQTTEPQTQNNGNHNADKTKTIPQTQTVEPDKSGDGATVTG